MHNGNRPRVAATLALIATLLLGLAVPAARAQDDDPTQKPAKEGKTSYAALKIGDTYKVAPADQVQDIKKTVDADYKEALRKHSEAKKAAAKAKEKFRDPKPTKPKIKILGSSFPSAEAAQEHIDRLKEKENKKGRSTPKPAKKSSGKKKTSG